MLIKQVYDHSLFRFVFVGGFTTLIQFGVLISMVEFAQIGPTASSVVGYLSGAACNYLLNYYFTFRSNISHIRAILKFAGVVGVGVCVNVMIFVAALKVVPWYVAAQTIAVIGTLISNYTVHRFWIYKR